MNIFAYIFRKPSAPRDLEDLASFKSTLVKLISGRLDEMFDDPNTQHAKHIRSLKEEGVAEGYKKKLLIAVSDMCEHAEKARKSQQLERSKDRPPNDGSLQGEIQIWAMMGAGIKLNRSIDISGSMVVAEESVLINDRDYLWAVLKKNQGDDGLPGMRLSVSDSSRLSVRGLQHRLLLQSEQDMFNAEFWAHVSYQAGNRHALDRFKAAADEIVRTSVEYWRSYSSDISRERLEFQILIAQIENTKDISGSQFVNWDKQLRDFFNDSKDGKVQRDAFKLWDSLGKTWEEGLTNLGKREAAEGLRKLRTNFKEQHLLLVKAQELMDDECET